MIAKWRRVAEECLLGENWAKIDVRTSARIKKVIWDQLLATKAEIIQLYFQARQACFALSPWVSFVAHEG